MLNYWRERVVTWGECDPFGLVYYPHMLAWFNDCEHALWRALGHPIEDMIARDRTTFVMGEVAFRFTGPDPLWRTGVVPGVGRAHRPQFVEVGQRMRRGGRWRTGLCRQRDPRVRPYQ